MASTDGRVVLITGANTGIGYEVVKALLRSDKAYSILLGGRDLTKAEQAAATPQNEIVSKCTVTPIQIDVESDDSIEQARSYVEQKFGRLDCLINNAGKLLAL